MAKDILIDANNDVAIINGDFAIAEADSQNLDVLMATNKGMLKQYPTLGPNLISMANARMDVVRTEGDIKQALDADGWQNTSIEVNGEDIYVQANRAD